MASDVNFKLRFEISNLNYPGNYVYVVLNTLFGCLRGHEGLQMTSEVATDLKFEISGLNNPCSRASLASIVLCLTNLPEERPNIIPRPAGFAAGKNLNMYYLAKSQKEKKCHQKIGSLGMKCRKNDLSQSEYWYLNICQWEVDQNSHPVGVCLGLYKLVD